MRQDLVLTWLLKEFLQKALPAIIAVIQALTAEIGITVPPQTSCDRHNVEETQGIGQTSAYQLSTGLQVDLPV